MIQILEHLSQKPKIVYQPTDLHLANEDESLHMSWDKDNIPVINEKDLKDVKFEQLYLIRMILGETTLVKTIVAKCEKDWQVVGEVTIVDWGMVLVLLNLLMLLTVVEFLKASHGLSVDKSTTYNIGRKTLILLKNVSTLFFYGLVYLGSLWSSKTNLS